MPIFLPKRGNHPQLLLSYQASIVKTQKTGLIACEKQGMFDTRRCSVFFYELLSATACISAVLYLVFLIGMNELSRANKWIGGVHRPSRRFDRLRLAPHRRRGHRSRYVASMGENVLMPRRSHSGLTDCLLPRVPEEVHRLHSVCHLCNQHPGSLHPRFSAYGRQRHRGRLHGRRRTMEHHQRHSRHLKRRLHLRILRHHRQPR